MDEPTKGLDPISAQALFRLIRERVVGILGNTIVMTSHVLRDIEKLCDHIAILKRGGLIACGTQEELRLVSGRHERYRLHVRGLSDQMLHCLGQLQGVVRCHRVSQDNGIAEIELHLVKDSHALTVTLDRMLQERCGILRCTLEEEHFEDVFIHLVRAGDSR